MKARILWILTLCAALAAAVSMTASLARAGSLPTTPAAGEAQARSTGGPASLDAVVAELEKKYDGRVTEVELERSPLGDYYEIEIRGEGRIEWDIVVDARTGEILREHRDFD